MTGRYDTAPNLTAVLVSKEIYQVGAILRYRIYLKFYLRSIYSLKTNLHYEFKKQGAASNTCISFPNYNVPATCISVYNSHVPVGSNQSAHSEYAKLMGQSAQSLGITPRNENTTPVDGSAGSNANLNDLKLTTLGTIVIRLYELKTFKAPNFPQKGISTLWYR